MEDNTDQFYGVSDPAFWADMNNQDIFQWNPASPPSSQSMSDEVTSSPSHSSGSSYPSSPFNLDNLSENTIIDMNSMFPSGILAAQEVVDIPSDDSDIVEKRPKKRGRKPSQKDFGDADVSQVLLNDRELLEFSSQDYEDKLTDLKRAFSPAEQKKSQDIRRKIKNRESARNSREKKKKVMETLEVQVNQLQREKEQMREQINALQKANKSLTEQVASLTTENQQLKGQSVNELRSLVNKTSVSPANAKKAGTALLVLLFSFGLLFNINRTSMMGGSINDFVQAMQNGNQVTYRGGRTLQSLAEEPEQITSSVNSGMVLADPPRGQLRRNFREDSQRITILDEVPQIEVPKIQETHADGTFTEFSNDSRTFNETTMKYENVFDDVIKYRPNTAYFACGHLTQLTPPQSEPFDQDSAYYISFIVPSNGLSNGQLPLISNEDTDNALVEIHCRVVDVHISPAGNLNAPVQVVS